MLMQATKFGLSLHEACFPENPVWDQISKWTHANPLPHCSSCILRQSLQIPGFCVCPFPLSLRLPVSTSSLPFPSLQRLTFSPTQKELPGDKFLPSRGSTRLVRQGRRECKQSAITFIHVPSRQVKYQFLYMIF